MAFASLRPRRCPPNRRTHALDRSPFGSLLQGTSPPTALTRLPPDGSGSVERAGKPCSWSRRRRPGEGDAFSRSCGSPPGTIAPVAVMMGQLQRLAQRKQTTSQTARSSAAVPFVRKSLLGCVEGAADGLCSSSRKGRPQTHGRGSAPAPRPAIDGPARFGIGHHRHGDGRYRGQCNAGASDFESTHGLLLSAVCTRIVTTRQSQRPNQDRQPSNGPCFRQGST